MRVRVVPSEELKVSDLRASTYVVNPGRVAKSLVGEWIKKFPFMDRGTPAGRELELMIARAVGDAADKGYALQGQVVAEEADRRPYDRLIAQETEFLIAAGWKLLSEDNWQAPAKKEGAEDFEIYGHGHAVNSELLHGPARGTSVRGAMHKEREEYLLARGWKMEAGENHVLWRAANQDYPRSFKKAVNAQKLYDAVQFRPEKVDR